MDELLSKPSSISTETHNQVKPKPTLKPRPGKTVSQVTGTGKAALQPKPKPAEKSTLKPKPSAKQSNYSNQSEATYGADNLGTDDIMKYIQNVEETEDDVDLFSWFNIMQTNSEDCLCHNRSLMLIFTERAIRLC